MWVVGNGRSINPFGAQCIPIVSNPCKGRGLSDLCPAMRDLEDKIVWGPTKGGQYSVKSGYKQALIRQFPDFCRPDPDWTVWKRLWHFKIPPKWTLFLWKCLHNILPVKHELKMRGLTIDVLCSRCSANDETIEHLFFDCPLSQRVWRGSILGLDFGSGTPLSFFSWFKRWVEQITNIEILFHSIALLWAIWLQRNSAEFHGAILPIDHILQTAREVLSTLLSSSTFVAHDISYSDSIVHHSVANQVILQNAATSLADYPQQRIVVDGSWTSVMARTGLAWVWLDDADNVVKQEAILGPHMLSPQQTEAVAVLQALLWASQQGIKSLILQTDCLVLVQLMQHFDQDEDWQLHSILHDILLCTKHFVYVVLEKVDRAVVQPAHFLAHSVTLSFET
ncbi:unnamed protein product [Camellia sinensis]